MPESVSVQGASRVPLVRTSILRPILDAFRAEGHDPGEILAAFQLDEDQINDPHVFITHDSVYGVYTAIAERAGQNFCARTGHALEWETFVPFRERLARASTVGDYFTTFTTAVSTETNAARQTFFVEGAHAYFAVNRRFNPKSSPAQADAFQMSVWLSLLHRVLDFRWDPARVLVRMTDPKALPRDLYGVHPIQCEPLGFSIRFPADWLALPVRRDAAAPFPVEGSGSYASAPTEFLLSVRGVIRTRIGTKSCAAEQVAEACGYSVSALSRRLGKHDLTISKVISSVYLEFSQEKLLNTDRSIGHIATELGYSDPTAFSRAFRKWSGMSPAAFRKSQKGKG